MAFPCFELYWYWRRPQSPEHDRHIPDEIRREVLRRDRYQCRKCNWSHDEWNRGDPRHLELHPLKHHARGGPNIEENLITLCTVCHNVEHKKT
ncbi:MAG: HNH endonuclease [Acidobacteriota bacterium]